MYREYIAGPNYVSYYEQAVRLSAVYITALFEIYTTLAAGKDFTEARRNGSRESSATPTCRVRCRATSSNRLRG